MMYSFADEELWPQLKMHQSDDNRQARGLLILLFAPYGKSEAEASRSSSLLLAELTPPQKTPFLAGLVTPINIPYLFDATFLSFTEEELNSLLSRYIARLRKQNWYLWTKRCRVSSFRSPRAMSASLLRPFS